MFARIRCLDRPAVPALLALLCIVGARAQENDAGDRQFSWLATSGRVEAATPAEIESARLELQSLRESIDSLLAELQEDVTRRLAATDEELLASFQQSMALQLLPIEWSWKTLEQLPPSFLPLIAESSRPWRPMIEGQIAAIRQQQLKLLSSRPQAGSERAVARLRSEDACTAASDEARICDVTDADSCYSVDALACIDFCGGALGFPVALKAVAGDEIEVTVAGFGFNVTSPHAMAFALVLHIVKILCNLIECGVDVTNECTRNEVRELVEQHHRYIDDFELAAATATLLADFDGQKAKLLSSLESARAELRQVDESIRDERSFLDDEELADFEADTAREMFGLREQLCTLEALLYAKNAEFDSIGSACQALLPSQAQPTRPHDTNTARWVLEAMRTRRLLPSLYLPASVGGMLDFVRALALRESRQSELRTRQMLREGDRAAQLRRFPEAYAIYCRMIEGVQR